MDDGLVDDLYDFLGDSMLTMPVIEARTAETMAEGGPDPALFLSEPEKRALAGLPERSEFKKQYKKGLRKKLIRD